MSGLLLAGLPDREVAIIEVLVSMTWRDLSCIALKHRRLPSAPVQDAPARDCQLCLVDLAGLGLREHSSQNQARLLALLEGRSAVLLVRGDDGEGWSNASLALPPRQQLEILTRPYGSAALKEALQKIMVAQAPARRANAIAAASGNGGNNGTGQQRRDQATRAFLGLGQGGFDRLLQVFPAVRQIPLMRLIGQVLPASGGHLVHLGPSTFVMDFRAGWLASAYPVSPAVMRMLSHRLDGLTVEPLPAARIKPALHRHFPQASQRALRPLDVITWELVSGALGQTPLEAKGDLALHLWRFPNFTQLQQVSPLDVQLAAICARSPQSLQQLLRAFPGQEQPVYRFCVLAIVSALAVVLTNGAPGHEHATASTAQRLPLAGQPQRGFLKSLLDRLF